MPRAILVPLDGSPLAERALAVAVNVAQPSGAHVILLRSIPDHVDVANGPEGLAAAREDAKTYLVAAIARLHVTNAEPVVVDGPAAPAILDVIHRRQIDLVIMSTHGRSGIGRWIYGSVADDVMRHAEIPVLLVCAGCPLKPAPKGRPPRVLVTLDYSALSETVLAPVKELARGLKAEIILLSVTPLLLAMDGYGQTYLAYDVQQDQDDRKAYLEGVAANLRADGFPVSIRVEFGFPTEMILDVAREEEADVIALSTHGSGGLTRLLMGSVATGIVQRASVPVLIVRPSSAVASNHDLAATASSHGAEHKG